MVETQGGVVLVLFFMFILYQGPTLHLFGNGMEITF